MPSPLYLKSENFGFFDITFVPRGGICPPGTLPQPVPCEVGPCPDLCVPAETLDLTGEPLVPGLPPTAEEVAQQQVVVSPAFGEGGLSMLAILGIGALSLIVLAGARRPR